MQSYEFLAYIIDGHRRINPAASCPRSPFHYNRKYVAVQYCVTWSCLNGSCMQDLILSEKMLKSSAGGGVTESTAGTEHLG